MKTKNILICGLIGTLIGGGANALDTSEIKAKCEQSDKTVWVEATKVCVPKNPCKNDKYSAYCNKRFSDMKFSSINMAKNYAEMYLLYWMDMDITGGSFTLLERPGMLGQDYIAFDSQDGDYIVFEFDSLNASNASWKEGPQQIGYCDEEHYWLKYKTDYLPEFCMYHTDNGEIYVKKENIKGNSIYTVADVFSDLFNLTGGYGETIRNGASAYYFY